MGFTIVELVIVIAVIAILAGVLIPTFKSVVESAHHSNALQIAKNQMTADMHDYQVNALNFECFIINYI